MNISDLLTGNINISNAMALVFKGITEKTGKEPKKANFLICKNGNVNAVIDGVKHETKIKNKFFIDLLNKKAEKQINAEGFFNINIEGYDFNIDFETNINTSKVYFLNEKNEKNFLNIIL